MLDSSILSAITLNCQSLFTKRETFINLIEFYNRDIIFGSESWLKSDIKSTEVFPSNYIVYRCDRDDGYGGVFVACRDSLMSYELDLISISCELVVCQVKLSDNSSLIVCLIYRPPSSNDCYLENLCEQLECIKRSHPISAIWISGDINLPDIHWSDNFVDGHSYSLRINNIFLDFLNNNGLTQIVNSPTRGSNVLDIFVTNRPSTIDSCETVNGISDHEAVLTKSPIRVHLSHPVKRPIYYGLGQILVLLSKLSKLLVSSSFLLIQQLLLSVHCGINFQLSVLMV